MSNLSLLQEKPMLTNNCVVEEMNGKWLFIIPDQPNWVCVNSAGAIVLHLCDGNRTVEEIIEILVSAFNVNAAQITNEISNFIGRMRKFFFISTGEEKHNPTNPQSLSSEDAKLSVVYFNITSRCNLHCLFCYIDAGLPLTDELSTEKSFSVIDSIAALGCKDIVLSGGEPLLRSDVFDLARYARESKHLKVTLLTNGVLITDEKIAQRIIDNFHKIQISLESINPKIHDSLRGEGSFESTMKAINVLKNLGASEKLIISPVITKLNIFGIPDLMDWVYDNKFSKIALNVFAAVGRGFDHASLQPDYHDFMKVYSELFERSLKHLHYSSLFLKDENSAIFTRFSKKCSCGFGSLELSIASNGDVYPCHTFHTATFKAGSVKETSLETIYHNSHILRKCRETTVDVIDKCNSCSIRFLCGGGCRSSAYYASGKITSIDPLCQILKFVAWKNIEAEFLNIDIEENAISTVDKYSFK